MRNVNNVSIRNRKTCLASAMARKTKIMRQHIKNKKNNIKSVARLSENVWFKKRRNRTKRSRNWILFVKKKKKSFIY